MNKTTKTLSMIASLLLLTVAAAARADEKADAAAARADIQKTFGFVPMLFQVAPDSALPGAWEDLKLLQMNPKTALSGKTKELIGLGVAAQVPCRYCVYAHKEFAKLNGATDAEMGDALTMAAITRRWSTVLNGLQIDDAKFRSEVDAIVANVKKGGAAPASNKPGTVGEIERALGVAPEFLRRYPEPALAGAWREMRDVQLNPKSALSGKDKELVGLAVSAQVPCKFCTYAHTAFAKLNGATDAEISEAVAMGALTRHWSTLLNGALTDEAAFQRDIDRLVRGAKKAAAKPRDTAMAR